MTVQQFTEETPTIQEALIQPQKRVLITWCWYRDLWLSSVLTNCSNNYGPIIFQKTYPSIILMLSQAAANLRKWQ